MQVKVSYRTTLPLKGLNPKVTIIEDELNTYRLDFIDRSANKIISSVYIDSNKTICAKRQWFTYWQINIYKNNKLIYTENFDPIGKKIFIKIDARALGDNLAWIPYIEEFRIKHSCHIICSTFFNELFESEYPELLFVKPNTEISNVYAQYYIGTVKPDNIFYSPFPYGKIPLQKTATSILGLEFKEINCRITKPKVNKTKSVCISEKASDKIKQWDGNWQEVVDYLVLKGYEVKVISKEPTLLKNIIDKTGDIPLSDRVKDLCEARFFIGVSSGLSWLAHACETYVFIISDYTPKDHEFSENCTRIYSNSCRQEVIQQPVKSNITVKEVIEVLLLYLNQLS